MQAPKPDLSDRWIQQLRKHTKTTQTFACIFCLDRRIFATAEDLWEHAKREHGKELDARKDEDLEAFRLSYVAESAQKRLVLLFHYQAAEIGPQKIQGWSLVHELIDFDLEHFLQSLKLIYPLQTH